MRRVGQARRRDSNEPDIIDALERIGALVLRVSGPGLPDLFVRYRGTWYAMEVKTAKGKRTDAQQVTQFPIVRSPEEAIRVVGGSASTER